MQEFAPIEHFYRFLRLWWVLLAAALVGGLIGYFFSRNHAPVYEAIATYSVNIDLDKVPRQPLELHDEDLALSTTQAVLLSPEVTNAVLAEAARLGYPMDITQLLANSSIERQHAFWILRFRSPDPTFAQTLVNFWATIGYQTMLDWQAAGKTPAYVIYSPPTLSGEPIKPVYFGTNKLVLAGSLIGWFISLLIIELIAGRPTLPIQHSYSCSVLLVFIPFPWISYGL
jgi:hypothetical protein